MTLYEENQKIKNLVYKKSGNIYAHKNFKMDNDNWQLAAFNYLNEEIDILIEKLTNFITLRKEIIKNYDLNNDSNLIKYLEQININTKMKLKTILTSKPARRNK